MIGAGEVEEGTCEFASGGGVEGEAASGEDGAVVLARDGEGGDAANFGVAFHDANEVGAGDRFDGAEGEGFGGDVMQGALLQSGKAEDIAGAGEAEEEGAAFAGGGCDFDASAADEQEVVCG